MANPFDQFDSPGASGNPFDQFDSGGAPNVTQSDAFLYNAADSFSLGFGDEIAGAAEGIGASLQGDDYMDAYRKRVDSARERLAAARAQHPISSLAGSLAGAAPLALATGGAGGAALAGRVGLGGLTRAAAGRGIGAMGAQAGLGALGGAAGGAAYGFGAGDGDLAQRGMSALQSGAGGAAFGAASPLLFQGLGAANPLLRAPAGAAVGAGVAAMTGQDPIAGAAVGAGAGVAGRPAIGAAKRAWDALPGRQMARSGQTNAFIGLPIMPERPAAPGMGIGGGGAANAAEPPPSIPGNVVRDYDRILGRQQLGVDDITTRIDEARAMPLGRTLADVTGEQALAKADAIVQLPGETGPIAKRLAEQRARDLPGQIENDLKTRLGVTKTPYQAGLDLEDQMRANGGIYNDVTGQAPKPQVIAGEINPMVVDDPLFQNALQRVQRYEARAIAAARRRGEQPPAPGVGLNAEGKLEISPAAPGRTLHMLKMAFDDEIGAGKARTDVSSIGKFEATEIGNLRKDFLDALDKAMPGYTAVREAAGGLFEQQRALELGRKALSMNKNDVREIMAGMSKFEKDQFRIAIAEDAVDRLEGASGAVSYRNAANALERNKIQNVFREVFDSPEQAEEFLAIANERNVLMRNASGWMSNSATVRRAAQAGDQALAQMADMGAQAATGNMAGAAMGAARTGYNALVGRHLEKRNNELGNALLKIIDDDAPENRAYIKQLLDELRKLERERMGRAQRAGGEGLTGAIGGGAVADEGY